MTKNPTLNSTWISDWRPEDEAFWNATGKTIARRNLIWSIVAEHIGFSVWLIWSIVTTKLPQAGFHYTTDQLFQLVAVPGLIGALMRFPYTFAVTTFGGRNWTIFSAAILFIPTLSLAYFVSEPDTPFWLMLLIASTAGLGGGNFASSMTNISFFFPDRMKGWALGLNAAGGNIGVSSVQLLTPILMTLAVINLFQASPVDGVFLQNAGLMWVLPIAIAVFGAVFFMNNLTTAKSSIKNQLAVVKRKHTWIMAYLYIGTFGSFIGYSAAFPLLIKTQFPMVTIAIAFLGPLVGSLSRPFGGWLADKVGGSIITFWNFIAMAGGDGRRGLFRRAKGFYRLPVDVPDPVRHHGHRQRLDLPHDPLDLPRAEPVQGAWQGRCGARAGHEDGEHRERCRGRPHRRGRCRRRLSDPERFR
ncbi:nitrate/nitrite transporter NarK [Bradyrhizobium sp. LM2.7]